MVWALRNLPVSEAVAVDPWVAPRKEQAEAYAGYRKQAMSNLAEFVESRVLQIVEQPSHDYLPKLRDAGRLFDLIYIDGDHRAPEALLDMQLAFRVLAPGGLIVVDDMQRCWHGGRPLVFFAAQSFELIYKGRAIRDWAEGRQIAFRRL